MKLECYFDGSIGQRNPGGRACYGFVIQRYGRTIRTGSGVVGEGSGMTNNVAEASGVIELLKCLLRDFEPAIDITIYGHSAIVIHALDGTHKKAKGSWAPYIRQAKELAAQLRPKVSRLTFRWIPRDRNSEADALADYRGNGR